MPLASQFTVREVEAFIRRKLTATSAVANLCRYCSRAVDWAVATPIAPGALSREENRATTNAIFSFDCECRGRATPSRLRARGGRRRSGRLYWRTVRPGLHDQPLVAGRGRRDPVLRPLP